MTSNEHSEKTFLSIAVRHARLAMKELRETLRDRRTIVTLVLMPVLVYPLLSMAFQRFLLAGVRSHGEAGYEVAVGSIQVKEMLEDHLAKYPLRDESGKTIELTFNEVPDLSDAVAHSSAVLGVGLTFDQNQIPIVEFVHRDDFESRYFARELESRLLNSNIAALRLRLAQNHLPDQPAAYFARRAIRTSTTAPSPLATLVPLILILMTITGAVYPAIDLTAGERERGTLETLIAAPIPRISLLLAKYVAVVTVALLTATVNLVAMTATCGPSPSLVEGINQRVF
jgi:ABC-2 type transport system permease protein/sodium transport system permease protein